jgi:hypothetical protein
VRDYSKVAPQFWTGRTGKAIRAAGRDVQVVALYLVTAPSANMLGLYYLPLPTLCHEVGISQQGAAKALRSLFEGGFARYDEATEVVFVPEMAKFQIGPTLTPKDNRWKAIVKELDSFKSCRFIKEFYDRYGAAYHLPGMEFPKLLASPSEGASEPLRSQEQEQEQEQERTHGESADSPPADPRPVGPNGHGPGESAWPSPGALVELWNASVPDGHPRVSMLSDARRKKAKNYLRQFPERNFWERAFAEVGQSAFLRGLKNGPGHEGFKGTFDWFLAKGQDGTENLVKVVEGRYRDATGGAGNGGAPGPSRHLLR